MPNRMKVVLPTLSALLVLSVGVVAAQGETSKAFDSIVQKYVKKDEKEVQTSVKALSNEQLVSEIDVLATPFEKTNDTNALIPFVDELLQRKGQLQDQEIIGIISDETSSLTTKEVMVDLYTIKHVNASDQQEIKKLLKQKNIGKKVKVRIVSNATFEASDTQLLKGLIADDDGLLAFQSLKKLSKVNAKEAYALSSKILANKDHESKDKVSAALKATAHYLKNHTAKHADLQAEQAFVELGLQMISNSNDNSLKDAAFFSLSNLQSKESIGKIITNPSIDRELKVFAVDQNFMVLKDMLRNNPSEADIAIVVQAMELLPIVDLVEDLQNASKNIVNKNLQQRCEAVINSMKANGRHGNTKWLDEVK